MTHAPESCLSFNAVWDGVGNGWKLFVSLYKSSDTDTPSVNLGYFNDEKLEDRGMVSLPNGSYRVVFSSYGDEYDFFSLFRISVTEGPCSGEGVSVFCEEKKDKS